MISCGNLAMVRYGAEYLELQDTQVRKMLVKGLFCHVVLSHMSVHNTYDRHILMLQTKKHFLTVTDHLGKTTGENQGKSHSHSIRFLSRVISLLSPWDPLI